MASRDKGMAGGGERIERDVRGVAAEQPGQRAGTEPAEHLEDQVQEPLLWRGGGCAERSPMVGLRAKAALSTIESVNRSAAHDGDGHDPVRETSVPRVRRRVEHVRQAGPHVTAEQPTEDLEEEMLWSLVLGLGEGEAPSGEGTDGAMGPSV